MEFVIVFVLGVIFGALVFDVIIRSKKVGSLRIDTSDPYDGPHMFLELHRGVEDIYHKKYVTLSVNTKNFISQE